MSKQIRLNLTLTAEEEDLIADRYGMYLTNGGRLTKNMWIKKIIMEKIE